MAAQALTFTLGAENYGVDILRVREIRGAASITVMPETPAHVLGVLNLRGTIVPVVDLRARFGLPDNGTAAGRVIIVLAVPTEGREHEFGLVVDAVSEVLDLDEATLKALPELGEVRSGCITALMEHGDSLVMLLDASRLLSASETQVH